MAYTKHNIVNGQYVHIEQTPASIGHRIGARAIDMILLAIYAQTAGTFFQYITWRMPEGWRYFVLAVLMLIPVLYQPVCEQFFGGMTVGKRALGLRVVMQSGRPVTIGSSILRALLEIIDIDFFLVGIVAMICNKRNQRLGDLAAGTIVINEGLRHADYERLMLRAITPPPADYVPQYPFAAELTWGQVDFINRTRRRYFLSSRAQEAANVLTLATMLAQRYGVPHISHSNASDFLRDIVADYNYYTWNDTV